MKLRVDKQADALYVRLTETPIKDSEEVQPGVILDFSSDGTVVGIEMLGISKRMSRADTNNVEFETV
ncbi:MAG: DUF2283 domain-containing protein [Chloroflexi bacterium]|nr:DUF2283 domain-containing protein [Chloroflexota bacterium]